MPLLPLLLLAFAAALPSGTAFAQDEVLQKVVLVSRHGVRSAIVSATEAANWSRDAWPVASVPPGNLTARGAQLAVQMGRYYRLYLNAQGAMPAEGCPPRNSMYVYADQMQRTRATGEALVEGMARECGITVRTRAEVKVDSLFHPLGAGVCKLDPMVAQTRVLERVGGNVNGLARDLKAPFTALQGVLDCCKPALCTAFGKGEACTLPDLPTALLPAPDGSSLSLLGGLPIASTSAETMLLQYLDGQPLSEVGWGRVTPAQLTQGLRLHIEQQDLLERTPYLARKSGSSLLTRVAAAVTSARSLGFGPPDPAVRDAKFVAYIGHDTNIVNLAGMLDVSWLQPGYQRNQAPPTGALMFEVKEGGDKKLRVYTSFVAQTLEQMRTNIPLTLDLPPLKTPLRLPGCGASTLPGPPSCTLEEFAVALRNVIDRDCVE